MKLTQREVTVVFRGGPHALKGTVIEEEDHALVVDGNPVGVFGASERNVIPWSGIAYVRVHPKKPVDQ